MNGAGLSSETAGWIPMNTARPAPVADMNSDEFFAACGRAGRLRDRVTQPPCHRTHQLAKHGLLLRDFDTETRAIMPPRSRYSVSS